MSNAYGIEETMDLVEFADKIVKSLAAHKADDGKIDGAEIASTLVSAAPAAISAMVGSGDISDELADLSDEEREQLIQAAMPVLMALAGMFFKMESK